MDERKSDENTRRRKALVHLASIDPMDLCNEATVERCRDLRSCGRCVQRILTSHGHAALCDECRQRCDVCPICRIPLPKTNTELPFRLYYECIEAGLIYKRCDDRLQDKGNQLVSDIQQLYYIFDVGLENNLVSLLCHCILTSSLVCLWLNQCISVFLFADHSVVKGIHLLFDLEVICLLHEIAGPTIHPKVAVALLERQNPDAALMALRWSGRDGGATLVSLEEALTALRVRLECGLLTEAFMCQRTICTKKKDKKHMHASGEVKDQSDWLFWVEVLVTEICCLCIRRNLIDRMIELPWNSDEEKHLHKYLSDFVTHDPSSVVGNLIVVFYLQRYRYNEAYQVDCKLQAPEEDFISKSEGENLI